MTDGRSFLRNSGWNLMGLTLPLALALVAIPVLVNGLGAERFGILTLAWAVVGYFSLFDLGLSRALTHAVSKKLGAGEHDRLPHVVWPALMLLLGLGIVGAVVAVALARTAVTHWLNVPPALQAEALQSFYIIGASLPLVLLTAGLRGLMEAHQHFGLVNALRVPLGAFTFVGPLLALPFSHSLVPAMWILFAGRVAGLAAHAVACLQRYDYLRQAHDDWSELKPLLRFGAWTTVTNVVGPLMVQMDRFFVAAVLPLAAVTHYVTPFEVMSRLMVLPISVVTTVFPAIAATMVSDPARVASLYGRSQRTVMVLLFPALLLLIALAPEGLAFWMHGALPPESATVLQWLSVGLFINALAYTPYVALQGAGRADLIARLHILELPLYAAMLWYFTRAGGLVGVAIAWTARVTIDAVALVVISRHVLPLQRPSVGAAFGVVGLTAALAAAALPSATVVRAGYAVIGTVVFIVVAWSRLLSATERAALTELLRSRSRLADQSAV